MPKISVARILFDTNLEPFEVPAFRGAIIEKVGREEVAFHNHIGNTGLLYNYPIIQYKSANHKAGIVCVLAGVDEAYKLFSKELGIVRIGQVSRELRVESVRMNKTDVRVIDSIRTYSIHSWVPLNEKNFKIYLQLNDLKSKLSFLEKMLVGNIMSFAKGINWKVDKLIETKIMAVTKDYWIYHKGVKLKCFDLVFSSNVNLPLDIGLGKGVSIGYGTLSKF